MKKYEKVLITLLSTMTCLITVGTAGFGVALICQFWLMVILWLWVRNDITE